MDQIKDKLRKITSLLCAVLLLTGTLAIAVPMSMPVVLAQVSEETSTTDTSSTEPAAETTTEPAAETTTEPAAETATEPAAETTTEPAAETTTEPAAETATEPAAETATEPAAETTESTDPAVIDSIPIETTGSLEHDAIEIGQPVTWTQTVELSAPNAVAIEVPADAEITDVQTSSGETLDSFAVTITDTAPADTTVVSISDPEMLQDGADTTLAVIDQPADAYNISFETPAPYTVEQDTSTEDLYQKEVTVAHDSALHYTDVKSYSDIPEDLVSQGVELKLYWMVDGVKTDVTSDPRFSVTFVDTDENGITDQMQWIVPQLSEQTFVIEGIIIATHAEHLDSARNFVEDVYDQVKDRDGVFTSEIPAGDYIRVTFEQALTNENDITIFAKSSYSDSTVEVYEKDSNTPLAAFGTISEEGVYQILLTNLVGSQYTFDLKVIGSPVEFDYVIDPCNNGCDITIRKNTVLDDSQDFSFTTTGTGLSAFSLDDDSDITLPNFKVFTSLANGGYTVTEGTVVGFVLTDISCTTSGSPPVTWVEDLSTRTVTITIPSGSNRDIDCTFTNEMVSKIKITKQTLPDGDTTSFTFTGEFNDAISDGGMLMKNVPPGFYSTTEIVPAGWVLTDITCSDDSFNDEITGQTTFNVQPDETVECIYLNSKLGKIKITKQTLPDGDTTSFTFTGELADVISDGGMIMKVVAPGIYTSTELVPAGWDLTSITCSDGEDLTGASSGDTGTGQTTFNVQPDETVECIYLNKMQARLIVIKHVILDDGRDATADQFTMSVTGTNVSPASFPGAESPGTIVGLDAGPYSVGESGPAGYTTSLSADCIGSISAGETKTCTITNDDLPFIRVTDSSLREFDRDSDPDNGQQFGLIFTQDPLNPMGWKQRASNPGQFYDNVFFTGDVDDPVSLDIKIPYPYVTQGAVPIHVYSGVSIGGSGEFVPSGDITSQFTITGTMPDGLTAMFTTTPSGALAIVLPDYQASPTIGDTQVTINVSGTVPSSGLVYVTIHLDYGLKKTPGYYKCTGDNADSSTDCVGEFLIPNNGVYNFAVMDPATYETEIINVNSFKHDPGFAGIVTDTSDQPQQGVTIKIYKGTSLIPSNLIATTTTDSDGVYLLSYKHTGKSATFTVKLEGTTISPNPVKVTVKANGWALVDFIVP